MHGSRTAPAPPPPHPYAVGALIPASSVLDHCALDIAALEAAHGALLQAGGSDFLLELAASRGRLLDEVEPAAAALTEPDALRHRYQVRLEAGGWWAWTRSYPAQKAGDWRLDIWLNGRPVLLSNFPVEGASAP